ncbi:CueP family metal-binding protein [Georgenia muralis]|uniref:CueP family metal-binding protein n=1 Tax=Georgenia muralis TaxID=154117 RepID=A0A3N5AB91_9MICO|nr:CueP family metal-binding protein [Georgenia muralis]RPF28911.1 hypothetical protein EDD32_3461 [Georgenia muralis]
MKRLVAAAAGALVLLAGCAGAAEEPTPPATAAATAGAPAADVEALLAEHDLADLDAAAIVDELDRVALTERSTELMASVRVDQLVLTDADQEVAVDLPDDRFYLSVAPYVDQTHECFYHSLTTCKGELGGEEVQVSIVDDATGDVLVDETVTTFDNGFTGFWLPRDIEATLTVSYDGKTAETAIGTGAEDPTCLTTVQLA